jgi:hypothetical protein
MQPTNPALPPTTPDDQNAPLRPYVTVSVYHRSWRQKEPFEVRIWRAPHPGRDFGTGHSFYYSSRAKAIKTAKQNAAAYGVEVAYGAGVL